MRTLLWLVLFALLSGCSQPQQSSPQRPPEDSSGKPESAEFGICYDARGCSTGNESWYSVTQTQCAATGARSWKGTLSGCVNF